jgi:hypothetical protein
MKVFAIQSEIREYAAENKKYPRVSDCRTAQPSLNDVRGADARESASIGKIVVSAKCAIKIEGPKMETRK